MLESFALHVHLRTFEVVLKLVVLLFFTFGLQVVLQFLQRRFELLFPELTYSLDDSELLLCFGEVIIFRILDRRRLG